MGSTGYGKFGDYPHLTNGKGASLRGGSNGVLSDSCPNELVLLKLDDVSQFDYYNTNHTVPQKNDVVFISPTIISGRIVVFHKQENKTLGSIPTEFNKYINCFLEYEYIGTVVSSGLFPVPYVIVSLNKNG